MKPTQENPVLRLSRQLTVEINKICSLLEQNKQFDIRKQLYRSGTSVAANISEAQHPQSLKDFIHKMKIASKEAEETMFWLDQCEVIPNPPDTSPHKDLLLQIQKPLSKIISSSINKLKSPH